ncbi:alpha-L-rhamnosidase C-terminal domain-containing protein [Streptomyces sp. NPDC003554]
MTWSSTPPPRAMATSSPAATLSEALDGSGSQNHHFLGQVDSWLINGLAGISQKPGSIAYRELDIHPAVVGDLTHASGSYNTPQGTVTSAWHKDRNGRLTLKVTIPAGSEATIHVPATAKAPMKADGTATPRLLERTATAAAYYAAAGTYTFWVG